MLFLTILIASDFFMIMTRAWYRVCNASIRVLAMYFSTFGMSPKAVTFAAGSAESSSLAFFAFLSVSSFDLDEFVVAFVFPATSNHTY